jgi:hypothetical protein
MLLKLGNSMKYRIDKPVVDLLDMLVKVLANLPSLAKLQEVNVLDNDVRTKQSQYQQAQNSYLSLQKKQMFFPSLQVP